MTDSTLATWVGSPNYSSREGTAIDRITLHIMAGRLAGTDSTFQNPARQASSTYGIGADGSIHQYVAEANAAWADGSMDSNRRTISIEHEGGLATVPCTDECIEASAKLCADIARRYGWTKLVHGDNVWLHREVPPHTHPDCPDICPNPLRWGDIINRANAILGGADTGSTNAEEEDEDDMPQALIQPNGESRLVYWDGTRLHSLGHPDEATAVMDAYRQATGRDIKCFALGSADAPWYTRFSAAVNAAE